MAKRAINYDNLTWDDREAEPGPGVASAAEPQASAEQVLRKTFVAGDPHGQHPYEDCAYEEIPDG